MKIKAAVLYQAQDPFVIEEVDLDHPHSGEVLVKMAAAGICHSDYHLVTGDTDHPVPVVAGHEGAGIIEAVGPGVEDLRIGQHVVLNWAPSCGHCFYCLRDRPSLCTTYVEPIWAGTMLDGTTRLSLQGQPVYHFSALACFAEYIVVPQVCCVPIPDDVPLDVACLVGCAVATGVGSVLNTARVEPGSSVVVVGAGGVGLNIIMAAKLAGASPIIAVDSVEIKADISRSFGATDAIINSPGILSEIRTLTGGRGGDFVFEAVGHPSVQELALDLARPGGKIIFVGLSSMGSATNLPGAIITRQEKTVTGSYYGTANAPRDFPLYLQLYRQGKLDLDRLISTRYRLEEINLAYGDMLEGKLARGVIIF